MNSATLGSARQRRWRGRRRPEGISSREPARTMARPIRSSRLASLGGLGAMSAVAGGVARGRLVAPATAPLGLEPGEVTTEGPGVSTVEGWAEGEAVDVIVRYTKFVRHACSPPAGGSQTV